jgi:hypothetical protein
MSGLVQYQCFMNMVLNNCVSQNLGEFLDQFNNYELLRKDSVIWS